MKQEISLHFSHQSTTGHDSKPDKSSLHSYTLSLCIIHFNIINIILRTMFVCYKIMDHGITKFSPSS